MRKIQASKLPEAIVSNPEISQQIADLHRAGKIRKIASRIYTSDLQDDPRAIVLRNLWDVIGALLPGALIADRTALENRPASDGSVFVVSSRKRPLALPGITVRPRPGVGPLPNDNPFVGGLYICSTARALLENMRPSRARQGVARTLSKDEIEERLEALLRGPGEGAVQKLRDEMRALSPSLQAEDAFGEIDRMIGGLLGTRDGIPRTELGRARRRGLPFDPDRIQHFETLHAALRATAAPPPRILPKKAAHRTALPFFDAYFSNFIEGTEFLVEEAEKIVFEGQIPVARPDDAHDIIGTFRLVSNQQEMRTVPEDSDQLLQILRQRHTMILGGRPEKAPGVFKTRENRAGSSVFVHPDLVHGTLHRGWEYLRSLETPFQRAVFTMFLVSEVHPFEDGNGRVARTMMNAELIHADECRIIIPTVYRNNYLAALKAMTQNGRADALIRTLDFAQNYTRRIPWESREQAKRVLSDTNAFTDPNEADLEGIRLRLPVE